MRFWTFQGRLLADYALGEGNWVHKESRKQEESISLGLNCRSFEAVGGGGRE